jgi:hypothetical protein
MSYPTLVDKSNIKLGQIIPSKKDRKNERKTSFQAPRKAPVSFVMSVFPSAAQRLLLDGFV